MLSGQLVPTSATPNNFVGQSEYFVDDDRSSYNVEFDNKNSKQEKEEQNFITATTNSDTLSTQGLLFNNNECQQQQAELLDIKKNISNASSLPATTTISNSKLKRLNGGAGGDDSSSSINSCGNNDLIKELDSGYNNITISSSNSPPSPPKLSLASTTFPFNSINYLTSGSNNSNTGYKNNNISKNLNTNLLSSLSAVPLAIVTNINNNLTNNNNNNYNNNNSNNYNTNTNNNNNNNDNNNNNNNNNNNSGNNHLNDATGRSAALERAYVHDVYANCEETTGSIRPRVAQFLAGLEPGSIVCDVGCGNGRYLTSCNPFICTIGVDRCYRLTKVAKEKGGEVALCDNLELPFRDESFDAVLSLAVVHHFATTERRVGAIRELARILRIGGRVIISVWALEQRHRRFESQDVLIPWQPPKNRTINYSDEEDEDDYLPPYHAYTEDSTNSSRSAGDGDSSSLSSSSPGESCYSFVRRAIQKLAGRRKHPWFLDSWASKDTKNNSSLDYEDAKDLPIELRRLEDFEDFPDPPLSAGLKSRSLGSILNPPPRQIVRSRSSVPSLGSCGIHPQQQQQQQQQQQSQQQIFFPEHKAIIKSHNQHHLDYSNASLTASQPHLNRSSINHTTNSQLPQKLSSQIIDGSSIGNGSTKQLNISPTNSIGKETVGNSTINNSNNGQTTITTSTTSGSSTTISNAGRRPKLIKQKQSLCDEEYQLPDNPFHISNNNNLNNSSHNLSSNSSSSNTFVNTVKIFQKQNSDSKLLLRKQSSLNEELMAENRLREKERVRKRIQKQMSLNEAFLCRSVFTKRLQIIREGFTTKLKTSTGSLERVTKNSLVKIMKNFQSSQFASQNVNNTNTTNTTTTGISSSGSTCNNSNCTAAVGVNSNLGAQQQQLNPLNGKCSISRKNSCQTLVNAKLAMQHCITAGTHSTSGGICSNCNNGSGGSGSGGSSNSSNNSNDDPAKPRRHSRESGSDSSKDSSLQSDTSIESEDSFASVIFIPKIENPQDQQHQCNHQQQQQQLYHQHQKHSSSTNSSSSNGGATSKTCNCLHFHQNGICNNNGTKHYHQHNNNKSQYILPPVPTSPLIMPCPPTPAHSPAAQNCGSSTVTSPPLQIVSGMLLSPPNLNLTNNTTTGGDNSSVQINKTSAITEQVATMMNKIQGKKSMNQNHFTFDDDDIKQQQINIPLSSLLSKDDESLDKLNLKITSSSSSSEKQQKSIQKKISPKITRQTIKDLPPIPKFRKQQSLHNSNNKTLNNFPIIRRSSAVPTTVTKLISLELFNPETDDLDSDSSEPSSPDSIDSVINTKPSLSSSSSVEKDNNKLVLTDKDDKINDEILNTKKITKLQQTKEYHSLDLPNLPIINNNYDDELVNNKNLSIINNSNQDDLFKKYSNNKDNLIVNSSDLITNKKLLSTTMKNNDSKKKSLNHKNLSSNNLVNSRQEFVDFAEQLSAQLLKSIDESNRKYDIQYNDDDKLECNNDCVTTNFKNIDQFTDDPYLKNHHNSNDINDLTDWREELRERRLNLANLSTQPSLQQSPISSSTSSLSSQTRSFTIHEEDEEEDEAIIAESAVSYSLSNYYDNRCKNLKYKYRGNFPLDYRNYNINPETAYLIQDGVDSHDDDDDDDEDDNVILEEDEEDEDNELNDEIINKNNGYGKRTSRNTIRCQDDSIESPSLTNQDVIGIASGSGCASSVALSQINNTTTESTQQQQQPIIRQSGESWALTNSSNSLDSPSQSGGSTTHHRYYHVFREGELDALINHHVTSLHIVSSYYERASWCVVAEKVQVWTI